VVHLAEKEGRDRYESLAVRPVTDSPVLVVGCRDARRVPTLSKRARPGPALDELD